MLAVSRQGSDDFMPGIEANRKGRIFITNQLTRPGWWNDWHEANGLGTYSDLKYQTFIREIGGDGYDVRGRRGRDELLDDAGLRAAIQILVARTSN